MGSGGKEFREKLILLVVDKLWLSAIVGAAAFLATVWLSNYNRAEDARQEYQLTLSGRNLEAYSKLWANVFRLKQAFDTQTSGGVIDEVGAAKNSYKAATQLEAALVDHGYILGFDRVLRLRQALIMNVAEAGRLAEEGRTDEAKAAYERFATDFDKEIRDLEARPK
jgi:hypothetical protein